MADRNHPPRPRSRRLSRGAAGVATLALASLLASSCQYTPLEGANCRLTPVNSAWRADVTQLDPHPSSSTWLTTGISSTTGIHADFGEGTWDGFPIGIPYNVVDSSTPRRTVTWDQFGSQSDQVQYPIPDNPKIEGDPAGDGDRHILMQDKDTCQIWELYAAHKEGSTWFAGSGVTWDPTSNAMRHAGWTSADAAGLGLLPGLVRWEELDSGVIRHAIRITMPNTRNQYVWPASHQAGVNNASYPPMGAWLRLKAEVDPNAYDPYIRPIIVALKTYGAIVADNGGPFFISGAPDERFDNDKLAKLSAIKRDKWEYVNTNTPGHVLQVAPNSYEASTAS